MSKPRPPLLRPTLPPNNFAEIEKLVEQHAAETGVPTVVPTQHPSPGTVKKPDAEKAEPAPEDVVQDPPSNVRPLRTRPAKPQQLQQQKNAASQRKLTFMVPEYLHTELRFKTIESETTIRYLILRALKKDGFKVEPADLTEDGRR